MLHPELYIESKYEGGELHFKIETNENSYPKLITKEQAKTLSEIFLKYANGEKSFDGKLVLIDN
jgi:hypothetical protein